MTPWVRPAGPNELALPPAIEEAVDEPFARHGIGPLPPAFRDREARLGADRLG